MRQGFGRSTHERFSQMGDGRELGSIHDVSRQQRLGRETTMKFYIHTITALARIKEQQRGATMAEYGLMLALIAVVCLTVVGLIGTNLRDNTFQPIANALAGVN